MHCQLRILLYGMRHGTYKLDMYTVQYFREYKMLESVGCIEILERKS